MYTDGASFTCRLTARESRACHTVGHKKLNYAESNMCHSLRAAILATSLASLSVMAAEKPAPLLLGEADDPAGYSWLRPTDSRGLSWRPGSSPLLTK